MKNQIILNGVEIAHKTRRIAYQILETFADEECVVVAGIAGNGFTFAKKISEQISKISPVEVRLCEVQMDKTNPSGKISTSLDTEQYQNKGLVLVDDVLNSGTTLMYGVRHFLDVPLTKFKTAVLVDRNHKKYPVKADFKGISLSTSLKEHVQVVFDGEEECAYLS